MAWMERVLQLRASGMSCQDIIKNNPPPVPAGMDVKQAEAEFLRECTRPRAGCGSGGQVGGGLIGAGIGALFGLGGTALGVGLSGSLIGAGVAATFGPIGWGVALVLISGALIGAAIGAAHGASSAANTCDFGSGGLAAASSPGTYGYPFGAGFSWGLVWGPIVSPGPAPITPPSNGGIETWPGIHDITVF